MFSLFFKKFLKPKTRKGFTLWNIANYSAGFTLLELIVVIAIFLIITGVVMVDIPNFREKSALDLTASEVATYVRGAQVFGASQKGGVSPFYAIHFIKNSSVFCLLSSVKTSCENNNYEERYVINGFRISDIVIDGNSHDSVDVVFRSNNYAASIGTQLEPVIYTDYFSASPSLISFRHLDIKIISVRSVAGDQRCVRVYSNGQISPIALANCGN